MTSSVGDLPADSHLQRLFTPRTEEVGAHSLCAVLERQVRIATCLAAPKVNKLCDRPVLLPRMAGLGTYLQHMTIAIEQLRATGAHADDVIALFRGIQEVIYAQTDNPRIPTLKNYRDFLLHGGVEPEDSELADALANALKHNSELINGYIDSSGGVHIGSNGNFILGDETSLTPLILIIDNTAAILHSVTNAVATYHTSDPLNPLLEFDSSEHWLMRDLMKWVVKPSSDTRSIDTRTFQQAIRRDLLGFSEHGTTAKINGVHSPFSVTWTRATSEGPQRRTDHFRIGPSNVRQWDSDGKWLTYVDYLKAVANWPVTISRLLYRLENAEPTLLSSGQFRFESKLQVPAEVQTRFSIRDMQGAHVAVSDDNPLQSAVDSSTEAHNGVPQIFFVTGEAGIGKTHNLFQASRQRARQIVDDDVKKPFYLYISCSGTGLKSLTQIINAEVNDTQNLNDVSVLTLCRNGLLVLVIDGFDELVGGAGYRDAFKLLAPLLKEIDEHGSLLLSARSSYFTNQYQASLEATSFSDRIPAQHLILELQRWRRRDVNSLFATNSSWNTYKTQLGDIDYQLLGVPFFAHAFQDYVQSSDGAKALDSLHTILIDSYLDREQHKLLSNTGQAVVDKEELRTVLEEVAGLIHESGRSYIDLDEFKLACGSALGIDDFTGMHRATLDRLTVLCGISATIDSPGTPLFSFEHELFYEVLLADFIAKNYLRDGRDIRRVTEVLRRSVLGDACVEALVKRYPQQIASAISEVIPELRGSASSSDAEQIIANNTAALTSRFVTAYGQLPSKTFTAMRFDQLDLKSIDDDHLTLSDCHVDRLSVSIGRSKTVDIVNCSIGSLEVYPEDTSGPTISISGLVEIDELHLVSPAGTVISYETNLQDILKALRDLGVDGVDDQIASLDYQSTNFLEAFAVDVFEKLSARETTTYIVEARNRTPGDGASRWMPTPGNALWTQLTNALESSGLATSKPLNCGGPPKLRISLTAPIGKILGRDDSISAIPGFWQLVS